jgi:hypothetical protein
MRQHPITPVTEPMQYRAIGVVRGQYIPSDADHPTRGVIRTDDGAEIDAVVLGRLLTVMRRHLDGEQPHLWVVYPRLREPDQMHLQMVGVWEPSTLDPEASDPDRGDALPEGDDYFSVRGELIYTRPETGDLVIKVRQQPRPDGSRPVPFKLAIRGEVPLDHLRHFVSLDLRRRGQILELESCEVIGPLAQRGNRGGKRRRPEGAAGGRERPAGSGRDRAVSGSAPVAGAGRSEVTRADAGAAPRRPAGRNQAISRPGR